jgi:hypothetical protein
MSALSCSEPAGKEGKLTQISMAVKDKRFARAVSVAAGTLGWIGTAFFGTILVMGERGSAMVLYGLFPALLSLGLLAGGGRFWSRAEERASVGRYIDITLAAAFALIALFWGASIAMTHRLGQ